MKEEAGFDVSVDMVIAVQDRENHNQPVYAMTNAVCSILPNPRLLVSTLLLF